MRVMRDRMEKKGKRRFEGKKKNCSFGPYVETRDVGALSLDDIDKLVNGSVASE